MPLHEAQADLRVNCLECWAWDRSKDTAHHGSWGTDLRVNNGTVDQLRRGGRARWRIEHETCNTLKNPGDHCAHHVGQGSQPLSVVRALLLRLAFLVDQVQQRCGPLCQAVWAKLGSTRRRWERMSARCSADALDSRRPLGEALFSGSKHTALVVAWDSS